jgi:hypothetical protein
MTLVDLTFLILNLNSIVDSGEHEGVTIDEVERHISEGDLFPWLRKRFPSGDFSIYQDIPTRRNAAEITEGLNAILGAYGGREGRKWGVRNNGICLLIAWTNELIQQRAFTD